MKTVGGSKKSLLPIKTVAAGKQEPASYKNSWWG